MSRTRTALAALLALSAFAATPRAQAPSPRVAAAADAVRAAPDAEAALAAAKRALVFARRDDAPAGRAHVAAAMLDAGLAEHARTVLAELLDAHPDEPAARELVTHPALALGVPRWSDAPELGDALRGRLVLLGVTGDACVRERAVSELARTEGRQRAALRHELEAFLADARPEVRRFAALALRRLEPGAALARLQRHAVLDREPAVRREAARALRDARDPAAVQPLAALLDEPVPLLRARAAQGLAVAGYTAAVEPLVASLVAPPAAPAGAAGAPAGTIFVGAQRAYVQGFEAEIAQSAAVAEPIIGVVQEGATLTGRVHGVSALGGVTLGASQRELRGALAELTGEDFVSPRAWERWWDETGRRRYAPADDPAPASGGAAAGDG